MPSYVGAIILRFPWSFIPPIQRLFLQPLAKPSCLVQLVYFKLIDFSYSHL